MTDYGGFFNAIDYLTLGAEHDLGAATGALDRAMDDPAATPDQIAAAEADLAEARAAYEDACAAAGREREAHRQAEATGPEPEAGL